MSDAQSPTLQSQADVWYLKEIEFEGKSLQIITQNFNGPCSFIAICNILILRGNILIQPPTRTTVSYEFLSQLVAEYLLKHSPNVDISDALSIMPYTQKGLDLNPLFTSPTSFLAANKTAGGELKLFSQVGIELIHGWLVDPDSPEAVAIQEEKTEDYDSAVALIAEADHIADGMLVPISGDDTTGGSSGRKNGDWTDVEKRKIRNALMIRHFLEQTQSQLTYHGLFYIASKLPNNQLFALFRSSHLSVLYKTNGSRGPEWQALDDAPTDRSDPPLGGSQASETSEPTTPPEPTLPPSRTPDSVPTPLELPYVVPAPTSTPDSLANSAGGSIYQQQNGTTSPFPTSTMQHASALYTLVTDQVFLNEPSVVWERIEDVDGSAGIFVDSSFVHANPAGGDWAGRTAEMVARDMQQSQEEAARVAAAQEGRVPLSDHELARQLQTEEENYARQEHEAYLRHQEREEAKRQKELHAMREQERRKESHGKKGCTIM